MLLSWSPEIGVEIGEPTILALSGEPSMILFKGSFEEHRELLSTAKFTALCGSDNAPVCPHAR